MMNRNLPIFREIFANWSKISRTGRKLGELVEIFGELVEIFGELVEIFGELFETVKICFIFQKG